MKLNSLLFWSALTLSCAAAACEKSSPTTPSEVQGTSVGTASVTDASTGVTVGAPQPVTPADGAQIKNNEQPLKLVIKNGVTTGSTPLVYTFEVATDPGFASRVYTKENVAETPGGQTSLTIDKIGAGKLYYWRARSSVNGGGPNSRVRNFTIGPEVVLQTPVPAFPSQGSSAAGNVTLTVNDVGKTGPVGQIFYRFELSDSASFGRILATGTVAEQGGQTSFQVPGAGIADGTYYWHVQASDPANAVTTPYSQTFSFQYTRFSLNQAIALDYGLDDFTKWPETTTITALSMGPSGINVDFTKKNGPDRWPDIIPPGFSGPIQYCLGMAWNINGRWYASAPIEMWNDRLEGGGPPSEYALNWFYNPARWAPMTYNQPNPGDLIGFFVTSGDTRGFNSHSKVQERSNVVLIPMPDNGGVFYAFSGSGAVRASSTGMRRR